MNKLKYPFFYPGYIEQKQCVDVNVDRLKVITYPIESILVCKIYCNDLIADYLVRTS